MGAAAVAIATLCCCLPAAVADDAAKLKAKMKMQAALLAPANKVETVRFADPRWAAVQVVRGAQRPASPGAAPAAAPVAPPKFQQTATNTERVSFGDGTGRTVLVVRGNSTDIPRAGHPSPLPGDGRSRIETVRFDDPLAQAVNIVRGIAAPPDLGFSLFGAAKGGELDRVAFAIDGVESGHGSTPLMWKEDLAGPQGPMQVSAAAALDVGWGNRFDMRENRLIGRAYIARLYGRYGNWPDAVAAYNWGPGNVDNWIVAGRPPEKLPLETQHYLSRVLRDSLLAGSP